MKRNRRDQDRTRTRADERPLPRRKDGEVDGRTRRRTGRHVLFAARVTEAFPAVVKEIAAKEKRTIGEVLEDAVRQYRQRNKGKPHEPAP